MDCRVAFHAQAPHVPPIIAVRMSMRQIVMSFLRGVDAATLTDWMAVEEQAIPLLAAVGLAGSCLRAPCASVTHFLFFPSAVIATHHRRTISERLMLTVAR